MSIKTVHKSIKNKHKYTEETDNDRKMGKGKADS